MRCFTAWWPLLACCLGLAGRPVAQAQGPEPAARCLMLPLAAAERVQHSALIVEGEVLHSRGFWDAAHRRIFTAHRVRVYKVFQGDAGAELTVLTEGGTVGLEQQRLTNTLRLTPGEQGILFLAAAPTGFPAGWLAYGSMQGFIRYNVEDGTAAEPFRQYPAIDGGFYTTLEAATGQRLRELLPNRRLQQAAARRVAGQLRPQAVLITGLSPLRITAGTGEVLSIQGSGFGAAQGSGFVEFRNADDGGATFTKPQPADYLSWSDTEIRVRVPSYSVTGNVAGSGPVRVTTNSQDRNTSPETLTVVYAVSNVQADQTNELVRPNHVNRNGRGGYTFQPSADFLNRGALPAFTRALTTWRCQTGVNWAVDQAPRSGTVVADDGANGLGFDDSTNPLPARVLGRTTSYYSGCRRANGQIVFSVKEFDMVFDDAQTWQFGPALPSATQYDFESVALHELGHAQQLSHLILPGAVMHYAFGRQQASRELNPISDVAGGRFVLTTRSFRVQGCGPAPMLPAPLLTVDALTSIAGQNEITWTTAAECFVTEFVVESSADTLTWREVGRVAATNAGSYRLPDAAPPAGRPYYRIGVVRPGGILDYTAPQLVRNGQLAAYQLSLYPNPVTDAAPQVQYLAEKEGQLLVRIYDAAGRLLQTSFLAFQPGLNVLPLSLPGLRGGWYLLRWSDYQGHQGRVPFVRVGN